MARCVRCNATEGQRRPNGWHLCGDCYEEHKREAVEEDSSLFRMFYECTCGETWEMEHECCCNDRCPKCDTEIEAYQVEDV